MSVKAVRYALGLLQAEPDNHDALAELHRVLGFSSETQPIAHPEALPLIESARRNHERRREMETAFALLRIETALRREREVALGDLLRFAEFELCDDGEVLRLAETILSERPSDGVAASAKQRATERAANWHQAASSLIDQAEHEQDLILRAALYARAADLAFRFAKPGVASGADDAPPSLSGRKKRGKKKTDGDGPPLASWLESALRADPTNRSATDLYLRTLHAQQRWQDLAALLERIEENTPSKPDRLAYQLRRAWLLRTRLEQPQAAMTVYEDVLDRHPGQPEALAALADTYTAGEMWDHLIALYEEQLRAGQLSQDEQLGMHVQIGMLRFRMQNKLELARASFESVRAFDPAHPGMLQFFREYTEQHGDRGRLSEVLSGAYRVLPDGEQRAQVGAELAKLTEESDDAQRSIERYRGVLRQEPTNNEARAALRRLYRQTGAMNALIDLLRGELERTPEGATLERTSILREIAEVYRSHTKSDSALLSVLTQLTQLLPDDKAVLRELCSVYERLGRHRDVLIAQDRLASLEDDAGVRAEIYRVVARKWNDQFNNVQNSIEAYEKLHEVVPTDREAREKLRELYGKRRAYRPLADLLRKELSLVDGPAERKQTTLELGGLLSERLEQGKEAIALYQQALREQPGDDELFAALERAAERDKDYESLAVVFTHYAARPSEEGTAALFKLATLQTERLGQPAQAKESWLQLLERQPNHPRALRVLRDLLLPAHDYDTLERVYVRAGDLEGLLDVFSTAADRSGDQEQKIELSLRVANLCETRLGAPERAFRAYERVLSLRPNDVRAARALIPLYEEDGRFAKAIPLYDILAQSASSDAERLELHDRLLYLSERELKDGAAAMLHARKAFELEPSEARLATLTRLAEATATFGELTAAVEARVQSEGASPSERRALRLRLAELTEQRGELEPALALYRQLLGEDQDDEEVTTQLATLLRKAGRLDELRALYEQRVERANTARKAKLLEEWAELEESVANDKSAAVRVFQRLLEIIPAHGTALRALSRLYGELGDGEGSLSVLLRDREELTGTARADREAEIAQVLLDLQQPVRALEAAKHALSLEPEHAAAFGVLEQLLPRAEVRADVAALLEVRYDQTGELDKQAEVLEVAIATRASKTDRIALLGKLANVHEQRGHDAVAFDITVRRLREEPADLDGWEALQRLGRQTRRLQEVTAHIGQTLTEKALALPEPVRASLLKTGAQILEDDLGDAERAQPYLEALYAADPSDRSTFERLKQLLSARERWQQLSELYDTQIDAEADRDVRIGLLEEAAIVAEEMRGDRALAARYFDRIMSEDPTHEQASRALEMIFRENSQHAELARVLGARLEHGGGDPTELRLELAKLHLGPLDDKRKAIALLDEVLADDPLMHDARLLLEQQLGEPELRQDVARLLERVHTSRDDARALASMLEIRLEAASSEEEIELLRQLAALRDERLTDDASAFETYGKLLPRIPNDEEVRERLLVIGRRLGNLEGLTRTLEETFASVALQAQKGPVAFELGQLYRERGESALAAQSFERARAVLESDDPLLGEVLESLDRLYVELGDGESLRSVLEAAAVHPHFDGERSALFRRLGELCQRQNDLARAVEAYEHALDEDGADLESLTALTSLYESRSAYDKLEGVLRRREELAESASDRRSLAIEIGRVLAEHLSQPEEAIDQYRSVLTEHGPDDALYVKLAELYRKTERWGDLAQVHEERAREASDLRVKIAEFLASSRVLLQQEDADGALGMIREALTIDPDDESARTAALGLTRHESVGGEAIEMLLPLLEASGARRPLLDLLLVQIDTTADVDERLDKLDRAIEIAEQEDLSEAFLLAVRAVRLAQDEPAQPQTIVRLERLASVTSSLDPSQRGYRSTAWAELAEVLTEVAQAATDDERRFELWLQTGALVRDRLSDRTRARSAYEQALELRADDERPIVALQELYEELNDHQATAQLLGRRAELAEAAPEQRRFLVRQANVLHHSLHDRSAAIVALEAALDLEFSREVADELNALYTQESRPGDRVALFERELGHESVSRERKVELQLGLGQLFEQILGEPEPAFDAYEVALGLDPQNDVARGAIERFLQQEGWVERAAEALEPVYIQRGDWQKIATTLEARVGASEDPSARIELLERLAALREEQEEDFPAALEAKARVFLEDPHDRAVWGELARLARVASAEARLLEIWTGALDRVQDQYDDDWAALSERTADLLRTQGDDERALIYYRRSLAFAPEAAHHSFLAIDEIILKYQRWDERVRLHRDSLTWRDDPNDRLQALHIVAALEEHELKRPEAAIETFRECLDIDTDDRSALDSLERLLAQTERFGELAELLEQIADNADAHEREARARLDLAAILRQHHKSHERAIDQYERTIELFGTENLGQIAIEQLHAMLTEGLDNSNDAERVVALLDATYQKADDWRQRVALCETRLAMNADVQAQVQILRERAELLLTRASDQTGAFASLRQAFVLDPADGQLRLELEQLALSGQRFDALASSYEAALTQTDDELVSREILLALAHLHDERRDDPRAALSAYSRLLALGEADVDLLTKIYELATLLSDWHVLVRVLHKRVELAYADDERASLLRQSAEIQRDMLEDRRGAAQDYERALELEPDSTFTVDQLIELGGGVVDPARLYALYKQRIDLTTDELPGTDDEDRPGLEQRIFDDLCAAAQLVTERDHHEAIEAYRRADELRPGQLFVLQALEKLFTAEELNADLLENLRAQRQHTSDAVLSRALGVRVAELAETEGEISAALATLRELLTERFEKELAERLLALAEQNPELRREAAEFLAPRLQSEGEHQAHVRTRRWLAEEATEPEEKLRATFAVADALELDLGDRQAALSTLLGLLGTASAHLELHERLQRLAVELGAEAVGGYADALAKENDNQFDAEIGKSLSLREADLAEHHQGDLTRAAACLVRALEQGGEDAELLGRLAGLYRQLGRDDERAEMLERRTEQVSDPALLSEIYAELGELFLTREPGRALASLRSALEHAPHHAAARRGLEQLLDNHAIFDDTFDILEELVTRLGDRDALVALHERRIARTADRGERITARLELARVVADDPARAQRVLEDALVEDPSDASLQEALEAQSALTGDRRGMLEGYARALEATEADLSDKTRLELWEQLGRSSGELGDPALAERAYLQVITLAPEHRGALGQLLELQRAPGREADRLKTLRARARAAATAEEQQADYAEALALLANEPAAAEELLREALGAHPRWPLALAELAKLRQGTREGAELLQRQAELEGSTELARLLRQEAAVAFEAIGERDQAVSLFEELLREAPSAELPFTRLRAIYGATDDRQALDQLLERRVEHTEGVEARVALRLELAERRVAYDAPAAIAPLAAVLEDVPHHPQAVTALSAAFEQLGRHQELAALLEAELLFAHERGVIETEHTLALRLGRLFEESLHDPQRALEVFARVLESQPGPEPLEATSAAIAEVVRLASQLEQWPLATQGLERELEREREPSAIADKAERLATLYAKLGDSEASIAALRRALHADPSRGAVRAELGAQLRKAERWQELAAHLTEQAEQLRTGGAVPVTGSIPPPKGPVADAVALYREAAALHLGILGTPAEGAQLLESASNLVPDNRELLLELCDAYVTGGRSRDATSVLERIIESFGTRRSKELAVYHHRLGKALIELGERDRALTAFDAAFRADPGNVVVLRDLGLLALDNGDLERAQKSFRALLIQKLDPSTNITKSEVFEVLGEIAERQGDRQKAIDFYKKALDGEPDREKSKARLAELG